MLRTPQLLLCSVDAYWQLGILYKASNLMEYEEGSLQLVTLPEKISRVIYQLLE